MKTSFQPHADKTHIITDCALGLAFKKRHKTTRKWPVPLLPVRGKEKTKIDPIDIQLFAVKFMTMLHYIALDIWKFGQ